MSNEQNIRRILEVMESIADVLPADRQLAFDALTFSLVDAAINAGITIDGIGANIEKVLRAREAAVRQAMS